MRAPALHATVNDFLSNALDVAANVKQQLERDARARRLTACVEDGKASGFVADILRRHSIEGASVAPPGCAT